MEYPHFGGERKSAVSGDGFKTLQSVFDIASESGSGTFFDHLGNRAAQVEVQQRKIKFIQFVACPFYQFNIAADQLGGDKIVVFEFVAAEQFDPVPEAYARLAASTISVKA